MWLPAQMSLPQHVDTFKKMGVSIDAKTLADPLSAPLAAIVSLGGCSASFVSADGLIVTNHHCVQKALQQSSSAKENLVEKGFLAKTKQDEKSAGPTQRVTVLQGYRDVTKEMRDGFDQITDPAAREKESTKRSKTLVAACEKDRPGIRCQVASYFRGGQFQLLEMMEIKDVRLVYVPERSIGNYGGEIDNWNWPRHTGDFSFYRAYVGKDGKSSPYSAENVPYKPKHFLKVASQPLKSGDFVMVAGYPGSTSRTATASEVHFNIDWAYPYRIAYSKEKYAIVEAHLKDGGETGIKATVAKQSIQNGLEKTVGILAGMQQGDLLKQKDEADKKAKEWAAQPGHEKHKQAIDRLEEILAEARKTARADFDRNVALSGSQLLTTAHSFMRRLEEKNKPASEKIKETPQQLADKETAAVNVQKAFTKSYDRTLDKASFRLALTRAAKLPENDRKWLSTLLGVKKGTKIDDALIDKTLDSWYSTTTLEDETVRLDLLQNGKDKDLKASKDPFIKAALRTWGHSKADEKKNGARVGELMVLAPLYVEAMREAMGGVLAPDANSTLRVTYGTVKSLHPEGKDEQSWPFTTGAQLVAKATGKEPFNAPERLLAGLKAKKFGPYADSSLGGDLPIDFLADLDITGGNSGSATLNDKGELVGLAFDGNKEGLASEAVFNGKTTRSIHVDARYMLWVMDAIDGADHLLKEMGIEPKL